MSEPEPETLGLIAGQGAFPLDIARSARRRGCRVSVIAFHQQTDPRLAEEASEVTWLHPGEVMAAVEALRAAGVRDAVLAGKLPKSALYAGPAALHADASAQRLLADLPDRRDDSILNLVAGFLERCGIRLLPQAALVPELLAGKGLLGRLAPNRLQRDDIAFGWPVAKALAQLDVGQTVVVKDGAVLAVEAIEGTDAAIRRGGEMAAGVCVVKVAKPHQDPRFDLPTIGPDTLAALVEARAGVLAFEAGQTIVLEREVLARSADENGIALLGVDAGQAAVPGGDTGESSAPQGTK